MRGSKGRKSGYLIDYLSSNGVLPSYSFPLHTVELLLPKEARLSEHLRLERDLRQAINEYAPGSEIVADKKIWRSLRPIFWKDTPRMLEYRICEHCHHLDISEDAGVSLPQIEGICPVCHEPLGQKSKIRKFVEPDGFIADPKSGKPARQYVNIEPNQMRSALILSKIGKRSRVNLYIWHTIRRKTSICERKFGKVCFSDSGFFLFSEVGQKEKLSWYIQTTTAPYSFVGHEYIQIPSRVTNLSAVLVICHYSWC